MPIQLFRSVHDDDSSVILLLRVRRTSVKPASTSTRASTSIMFEGMIMMSTFLLRCLPSSSFVSPLS